MKHATRLIAVLVIALLTAAPAAIAEVPQMMNYQGVLQDADGNPIRNETRAVVFAIYDDPDAGAVKWTETDTISTDNSGAFNILLGSNSPIADSVFTDENRWLGIQVNAGPELTPRTRLVSVAYSQRVSTVDGASGGTISGDVNIQSDLTVSEKVGIGTTNPQLPLHVVSSGAIHQLRLESPYAGGGYWDIAQSDNGFASGGELLVFTPDGVGSANSVMSLSNSGNVGIGTTTPGEKLTVEGNTHVTGDLTVEGIISPSQTCWNHDGNQVFSGNGPTSWSDLDLSSYVGLNRALVMLRVKCSPSGTIGEVAFRINGDTDDLGYIGNNWYGGGASAATLQSGRIAYLIIETDVNGIVEWYVGGAETTVCYVWLVGYVK